MYTFESRIRYSEVDFDGKLKLLSLLNYFQDATIFHSEDLGIGVKPLLKQKCAWVLNYWQIDIDRFANLGEKVTIGTHPYEFKKFLGMRNFCMLSEDGNRIAVANSIWAFLDLKNQKMISPTGEMLEKYQLEPKAEMEYMPRKIELRGEKEKKEPVLVRAHHLDTNEHVNNGQYVSIACDFLLKNQNVNRIRATYHKSAVLGDTLYPEIYTFEKGMIVALLDKSESPYAIIEFTERTE